jgi:sortase A
MGTAAGVLAIVAGLAIGANIAWFYWHSDTVGRALERSEKARIAQASRQHAAGVADCPAFSDTSTGAQGLLEAPAIALEAPVVAGTGDPQLDVAVGHLPGSAWPGQGGTAVLAAHDVSYFSEIDHLATGDLVTFVTPCTTYQYRVIQQQVVQSGSLIYSGQNRSLLVLETCYPLNALWLTSQRFLVTAQLEESVPSGAPLTVYPPPSPPMVPASPALVAQGLTLATNDAPLGTLGISGGPAAAWQQSPAPFDDEAAALEDYFAAIRSAEQRRADWWQQLATVDPREAAALEGATITENLQTVDPVLSVQGDQLVSAEIDATILVSGGSDPGPYRLTVTETVFEGTFVITGWSMEPGE